MNFSKKNHNFKQKIIRRRKTLKKVNNLILLLIVLSLSMTSCKDDDNNETYYKIEGNDLNYIPTAYSNLGNIISFKNQNDEVVRFKTHSYNNYKEISSEGWISGYYYDYLFITLLLLDMNISGENDRRCRSFQIEIIKQETGSLFHRVNIPAIGPSGNSCTGQIKQFYTPEITNYNIDTMTINTITYNKVLTFEETSPTFEFFTLFNNATIHKVYYDLKHGVIGFDDTTNNLQYRIVN